ncbi:NusA N-terminal domain protein [Leptospira interrogans serovar Canicola]|nr:NusA N-terminal domain protein [Leptospira interrogans serovar Canicola]
MAVKKIQSEGNLLEAIQQFCADKSLDREAVMGVIRDSLITAYIKKNPDWRNLQNWKNLLQLP